MRNIRMVCVVVLMIFILTGCNKSKDLVASKMVASEVDKIQVVLAMGNPEYGAKSKVINDKDEINKLVKSFNSATIDKKVNEDDVVIAGTSKYYFYNKEELINEFMFNGNDSKRIWYNSGWHYIKYDDNVPYEIYKSSKAKIVIVDEKLNKMK